MLYIPHEMGIEIKRILKKIIQRSRLGEYESIVSQAIEYGYKVMCLREWVELGFPRDKIFLLRHDVDIDASGAARMYQVEKRLKVRSTYYFRHLTMHPRLMKQMLKDGFEVGLHYETLASVIREQKITAKEQISDSILKVCRERLQHEIREFREKIGEMVSICSHGAYHNRMIGVANYTIVNDQFKTDNQISFETYDAALRDRITTYISDSSIITEHVWRYGKSPLQAFEDGDPVILLLTHPEHWNYDFCSNLRKLWLSFIDRN